MIGAWNNLNPREKWTLLGGIVCVFFYSYYYFLYAPIHTKLLQNQAFLTEKMETLTWMQSAKHQKIPKTKKTISNNELLTFLTNKLKENSNANFPYQLEQTHNGDIQLSFEEIPFDLFMNWLVKLNNQYTIFIKQLVVNKAKTAGVTKLTIVLGAGSV